MQEHSFHSPEGRGSKATRSDYSTMTGNGPSQQTNYPSSVSVLDKLRYDLWTDQAPQANGWFCGVLRLLFVSSYLLYFQLSLPCCASCKSLTP